jgi:hypothetical protein
MLEMVHGHCHRARPTWLTWPTGKTVTKVLRASLLYSFTKKVGQVSQVSQCSSHSQQNAGFSLLANLATIVGRTLARFAAAYAPRNSKQALSVYLEAAGTKARTCFGYAVHILLAATRAVARVFRGICALGVGVNAVYSGGAATFPRPVGRST